MTWRFLLIAGSIIGALSLLDWYLTKKKSTKKKSKSSNSITIRGPKRESQSSHSND